MKLAYVTPKVTAELFSANEYVAACIEATATCAIPGKYSNQVGDGTAARNNHGICGDNGAITFTTTGDASGLEKDSHGFCSKRPIS